MLQMKQQNQMRAYAYHVVPTAYALDLIRIRMLVVNHVNQDISSLPPINNARIVFKIVLLALMLLLAKLVMHFIYMPQNPNLVLDYQQIVEKELY
jgi:hypothetical protein